MRKDQGPRRLGFRRIQGEPQLVEAAEHSPHSPDTHAVGANPIAWFHAVVHLSIIERANVRLQVRTLSSLAHISNPIVDEKARKFWCVSGGSTWVDQRRAPQIANAQDRLV